MITFSGHATDAQSGTLAASALTWSLVLQHCPSTCHEHPLQTFAGTASGSFVAPDHEYPSHLDLRLTATDSGGLTNTTSVRLDPQTVDLTFGSTPAGADAGGRVDQPDDAVHPHRDPRLDALGQRALTAGEWWDRLRVRRLVGRRRPDAQHRGRTRPASVRRDLPGAAGRAGHLPGGRPAGPGPGDDHLDDGRPGRQPGAVRADHDLRQRDPLDRTLVTSHSVTITGLARKAQYFFQVLSRDGAGNLSSATGSFRTK